jgi:hypothetical protein
MLARSEKASLRAYSGFNIPILVAVHATGLSERDGEVTDAIVMEELLSIEITDVPVLKNSGAAFSAVKLGSARTAIVGPGCENALVRNIGVLIASLFELFCLARSDSRVLLT